MEDKNKEIKDALDRLAKLVLCEDTCDSPEQESITDEEISNLIKRDSKFGTIAKMLLRIMEDLDKIKEWQNTHYYYPWSPSSPGPNPLQVWYSHGGGTTLLDPSAPVTAEYRDSEGGEFTIDYTQPFSVTFTYPGKEGVTPTVHTFNK